MTETYTHIIMTRFNLATPGREFTLRTQPGWLDGRFELFERFCLPSIAAQTNRNFQWIIYFDKDTPDAFKSRIEELRSVFPFVPYYTGLFPSEGWRDSISDTFAPDTPLLLTTRLDNDDALASDYVARLHANITETGVRPGAYNFRNGLIRRGPALYSLSHDSNAFFSWLEPVSNVMRTAPSILHMKIAEHGPVYQIDGPPAWLQIVHEANVSNKVRGRRVRPEVAMDRFPESAISGIADISTTVLMIDRLALEPARALRDRMASMKPGG